MSIARCFCDAVLVSPAKGLREALETRGYSFVPFGLVPRLEWPV